MKRKIFLGLLSIILISGLFALLNSRQVSQKETAPKLKYVIDIPLPGGTNRWDYQSINYKNNRLYISHLGSNMVTVFDLKAQKVLASIPLSASPYGILVVPDKKKVFVGVGGNNQVAVIDESSLKVITYITAGETPDGLAYAQYTNTVFVSNENGGTVSVINAEKYEHIEDISVGGAVGNTHFDPFSKLIYSVSGEDNTLIEIDPTTDTVLNKYKTTGCSHPHGFYIDIVTRYAFITCQGNNKMIVFDQNEKKIIYTDTVGAHPDVLAYDPGLHRLYVAAESGNLTVFDVQKNKITKLGQDFIAEKAHTVSVDKNTHKVYMPLENINGKPILRIMQPN